MAKKESLSQSLKLHYAHNHHDGSYGIYTIGKDSELKKFEAPVLFGEFLDLLQKSEELQLALVRGPKAIGFVSIKNPSEKVALEAVKNEPSLVFFVQNPSEEMKSIALKKYFNKHNLYGLTKKDANGAISSPVFEGMDISPDDWSNLVKTTSYDFRLSLFKDFIVENDDEWEFQKAFNFLQIEVITPELRIYASLHGIELWDHHNVKDDYLKKMVESNVYNFKVKQAEAFLEKRNYRELPYNYDLTQMPVELQKKYIDWMASSENVFEIKFDRTDELLNYVVDKLPLDKYKYSNLYVQSIKDKTLLAKILNKNGIYLEDIYEDNRSDELVKIAVENNPFAIRFVKNPSIELQTIAVSKNFKLIDSIENPDLEVKKLATKLKRKDTIAKSK